jgi:hypothetical protein
MESEKSKVLGALLPSEQCHDEYEAFVLQYSYDMAHTFYLAFCLSCGSFSCVLKEKLFKLVSYPICFEG